MHKNVHRSLICNSTKLQTTDISINGRSDKVSHIHSMKYYLGTKRNCLSQILSWVKEASHKIIYTTWVNYIKFNNGSNNVSVVVKRWGWGSYSLGRYVKGLSWLMETFHIFIWMVITWAELTHIRVIMFVEIHQTVYLRTDHLILCKLYFN